MNRQDPNYRRAVFHAGVGVLFLLAGIDFASPSLQAQENPDAVESAPVLLLREGAMESPPAPRTIWRLNALNPTFVLYHDGLVIFKKEYRQSELFSAQLRPDEMRALLQGFNLEEFLRLEESYRTNNHVDQPGSVIKYWQDQTMKRVMVSGPIRDSQEDRNKAPQAFLAIFDRLCAFHHENARLWEPKTVQLHVFPYQEAKGESVAWPTAWPDLNDPTTKDTTATYGRESYDIFLNGDQRDELEQLLSGLKEKQTVLMNGRQWYVSPHRYLLPNEELFD